MPKFTKEIVDNFADKLLIGLTAVENKMVLDEFAKIDADIKKITEVPGIENIEPMTHCLEDLVVELRDDEFSESVSVEDALANCDQKEGREIVVLKVIS